MTSKLKNTFNSKCELNSSPSFFHDYCVSIVSTRTYHIIWYLYTHYEFRFLYRSCTVTWNLTNSCQNNIYTGIYATESVLCPFLLLSKNPRDPLAYYKTWTADKDSFLISNYSNPYWLITWRTVYGLTFSTVNVCYMFVWVNPTAADSVVFLWPAGPHRRQPVLQKKKIPNFISNIVAGVQKL